MHSFPHSKPTRGPSCRRTLLAIASLQAGLLAVGTADTVAYWNFNSLSIATASAPGSGGVPTTIATSGGSGTLSLTGWGGTVDDFGGSALNAQGGDTAEESLSLIAGGTSDPFPGNGSYIDLSVSFTGLENPIITFATRGTSTGFNTGNWSYSISGGAFIPVPGENTATVSTTFSTKTLDLSSFNALDGASDVVLRYTLSGATSSSGNNRLDNLLITATATGGDTSPPVINALKPADDASGFDATGYSQLTITFNEPIALGTGNILVKKVSDNSVVNTIDVSDFGQVDLNGAVLGLFLANPLQDDTAYYVEIPGTAITDMAPVPNAFPEITGNTTWNFTTAPAATAPTVAINKYLNGNTSAGDIIELLVIGDGLSTSTVDLRGMIVKDFTTNATADGGGKFEFTTDALWEAVPVGTLVVLENNSTATDPDDNDYVIRIGLQNTTYFNNLGAGLDIANTEMVLIKEAGSGASGTTGGIHALAGGTPGELFTLFPDAKVLAPAGNAGVIVTNPTSSVADFVEGTGATGGVALTSASFGTFNNSDNRTYILNLRGIDPTDGDGTATIANVTAGSPLLGSTVFARGLTGQSAAVTVNSSDSAVTLTNVSITVPAAFGVPGAVTLSGSGSTGASSGVAGQVVTISGASATDSSPLVVTIDGLTNPTPSLVTDNGNYAFSITTSGSGGTPSPIAFSPVAHVTVPIEVLRDVTANGVAVDLGAVVAVDGVVTEADFGPGTANYSGFLQDSTAGINIFAATFDPGLVAGNRFVVLGTVTQFSGLSEVVPSTASSVFDLGVSTPPAPQVVTLATLLADPEAYEGSLVTVQNLTYVSGTWAPASTVVLKDSTPTNIDVRIQAGTDPTITDPGFAAVNVTGIFGQFDGTNPFTSGYQLMPRRQSDIIEGTLSDFDVWAGATGATGGMAGDTDFDGRDNGFEYAFGLNPTSGSSVNPIIVPFDKTTGLFSYTRRKPSLTGLTYIYQYSTTLAGAWTPFTPDVNPPATNGGDPVETITVDVPNVLLAEPKLFIRVTNP